MLKRGQVTVFVIVGIVLFITIISFLFIQEEKAKSDLTVRSVAPEIAPIKIYLEDCFAQTLKEGINYIGNRGGYFVAPPQYTYFYSNVIKIPLYFYNDTLTIPSTQDVEESMILHFLNNYHNYCNLSVFEEKGYQIQKGDLTIKENILDEKIIAQISYPLKIKIGQKETEMVNFILDVPSRMEMVRKQAEVTMLENKETNASCISCWVDWSEEFDFEIKEYENVVTGSVVIKITDNKNSILDSPQIFQFAYKEPLRTEEMEFDMEWWK